MWGTSSDKLLYVSSVPIFSLSRSLATAVMDIVLDLNSMINNNCLRNRYNAKSRIFYNKLFIVW